MSHLADFERMLTEAGVGYEKRPATAEERPESGGFLRALSGPAATTVVLDEQDHEGVGGYIGFVTCFYFGADGGLVGVGVWE